MNIVAIIAAVFSVLGALDRILGNRFGLGKEFERGFMLLGTMALSMIGMIIISPLIADLLSPVFSFCADTLHMDPSIIPAALFANDMGGAPLAYEIAADGRLGSFNALVVSAMMGCTVSFTVPYALSAVEPEQHSDVLFGFLCGIVTIPLGCFAAGLAAAVPVGMLLVNLLPLVLFSALIAAGLLFAPKASVKIFSVIGTGIKILITVGLSLGVIRYLVGVELIPGLDTLESGAAVCLNASAVMTGAFPFMYIVSRLLSRPMKALGGRLGISESAAMGFVSSLATSVTTFAMMKTMDKKGVVMNSAFAVSAAFTFAGHLAFTLAFDAAYIFPVIIGKLIAGFAAAVLAALMYQRIEKTTNT